MNKEQRTILIVDDCLTDRETYRRYLLADSRYTYKIFEEEYGEDGLELSREIQPDVILLDFILPDIDGLEFIRELKNSETKLPVVMLTGQGNEVIAVEVMKSGAHDYLVKGQMTAESLRLAIDNVVERTRWKRQLEASEQRFRTSVENMLDCFAIYTSVRDRTGRIVDFSIDYVNGATCAANRMAKEEQIGSSLLELLPYHRETGLFDDYCAVVETEQPLVKEVFLNTNIVNSKSEFFVFDIRATKLDDGVVVSWRDITLHKLAEEEIKKALLTEKELNELKSRFISIAAHEFRNPLTSILVAANLIQNYSHRLTDEKKNAALMRIEENVKRMTELIDDVLLVSKGEAGKFQLNLVPMNLGEWCRCLTEEMQLSASENHRIDFKSRFSQADAVASVSVFYMDEKLLRHIFSNLLSNAIKYSPSGGEIEFTLTMGKETAVFQIKDCGIGIPAKDLHHLFNSFHRASNVGTIRGTGLGLAIVNNCVKVHGGTISVSSEVGKGTTFTVTLPLTHHNQGIG